MPETPRPRQAEFVALLAVLYSTIAFSIDSMLPALTQMGEELSPGSPENAALVVSVFLIGMGIGTLVAGPLSDAYGRKKIITIGFAIYAIGAIWSGIAPDLDGVLAGRLLQGLGIAGPRIAGTAMVRDVYSGDRMARIMSFAFTIFALVPAVAPAIGQVIIVAFNWRAIFFAFVVFAAIVCLWIGLRQPETLAPEDRRTLSLSKMREAMVLCFSNRIFRFSVLVQTLMFGCLFSMVSSIQPVYEHVYQITDKFPLFFACSILLSIPGSLTNSYLVTRFGMRVMIKFAVTAFLLVTAIALILWQQNLATVWVFFGWSSAVFAANSFTLGNLNALAMEPLGQIAGMAASIIGCVATVLSALLAIPVALAFDGTIFPLLLGALIYYLVAMGLMLWLGPRPLTE